MKDFKALRFLGRSESISSIDETPKTEPEVKTEPEPEASESMEVETNIATIKSEKEVFLAILDQK